MGKISREENKRYGKLVVISMLPSLNKKNNAQWLCQCDCGNTTIATTYALHSGCKKSCGCLHKESAMRTGHKNKKHGLVNSRIYHEWNAMKARCLNENNKSYPRYGGRGITVCDEWKDNFEIFREWALKNGYSDDLTIERKDVNKGYSPENCCWIPAKEQAKNRRPTLRFTDENGVEQYVMDIAKNNGLSMKVVCSRLHKGWTLEKALNTPLIEQTIKKRVVQYSMSGEYIKTYNSIGEANRITGVERSSISRCCCGNRNHAGNYIWKYESERL